ASGLQPVRTGSRALAERPPVDEAATVPRVRAALSEGRYDDAVALADALAVRDALAAEAHYLRGLALVSLGDDARALVALRKAVYLDATSGLAHFLLAGALERTGDAGAARREYRAAASTLAARDADAPELGGRGLADLVALCLRLSDRPDVEAP
ncbi:MAG: methyltransferase, CheR-type, partial [Frankiales bacterium]|nr:methyltransferase, CheR-type [Frankiales bacterium]